MVEASIAPAARGVYETLVGEDPKQTMHTTAEKVDQNLGKALYTIGVDIGSRAFQKVSLVSKVIIAQNKSPILNSVKSAPITKI